MIEKQRNKIYRQDKQVRQAQTNLNPRLSLLHPCKKNLWGMPDVRPKIHWSTHDKSHKISTQIRIRKRSSYVERNNY